MSEDSEKEDYSDRTISDEDESVCFSQLYPILKLVIKYKFPEKCYKFNWLTINWYLNPLSLKLGNKLIESKAVTVCSMPYVKRESILGFFLEKVF